MFEVVWAVGLKYKGFTRLGPTLWTLAGMILILFFLAQALKAIPLGTGYAVWTGIGAVATAIPGILLFGESRAPFRLACILLIIAGIAGLRYSSDQ